MTTSMYGVEIGGILERAGLIPANVKRIVIDIPAEGMVMVYYECYGDKKMIDLTIEELVKCKDKLNIIKVGE